MLRELKADRLGTEPATYKSQVQALTYYRSATKQHGVAS